MASLFLFKGIAIGLLIAFPAGPIGFFCLRRIITQGRTIGFLSGVGSALAESLYAFVAAFGVAAVANVLTVYESGFKTLAGFILVLLGMHIAFGQKLSTPPAEITVKTLFASFTSTFFLTLANPLIIITLGIFFAFIGLSDIRGDYSFTAFLAAGVFIGSTLMWLTMSRLETWLKLRLQPLHIIRIDRAFGTLIACFGLAVILAALT